MIIKAYISNKICTFDEVKERGFSLVPSKHIEFVNRDETVDYDTRMKELQAELADILREEAESRNAVLDVFKSLGYEINI